MFEGKNILITGGTGSFGRCCIDVLLSRHKPNRLVVLSRDELKQFEMQQTLSAPCMRYFLGDVRDRNRLIDAFYGIDYVIHAAALKQVEASEYNPLECIKTNIHGAENVIAAAMEQNVKKVIALSTDKAVNPINLYGATKLASDKLFIAANNTVGPRESRFTIVRYGNVVGSRGSVVNTFRNCARDKSKSIPITHPDMTRFWITLRQGVEFVLESFERMRGGEILSPKMPSARILDVAKAYAPNNPVEIVGIRPGEKLHETICPTDDAHLTLDFEKFYLIRPAIKLFDDIHSYENSGLGELGRPVNLEFSYTSENNDDILDVDRIRSYEL